MPEYTLYLTTDSIPQNLQVSPFNKVDLANVSWNINWDALFNNEQSKYKHCRLRFEYISETQDGVSQWDNYLGYLTCNLGTSHMATTGEGTILGLLYLTYKRRFIGARVAVDCHLFELNTMNTAGIDIIIPRGNSIFNVKMMNDDSFTTLVGVNENYQILMQFELYNEDI